MKSALQILALIAGYVFGATALIFGIFAGLIRSVDPSNIIHDGFGRIMEPTPILIRALFQSDSMWSGFGWFVFDAVFYVGLFGLAYLMFKLSKVNED